jgi:hypothetical protein
MYKQNVFFQILEKESKPQDAVNIKGTNFHMYDESSGEWEARFQYWPVMVWVGLNRTRGVMFIMYIHTCNLEERECVLPRETESVLAREGERERH